MCLGVPGRVIDIRDDRGTRMATVDFGGVTKECCLAYVPEAEVGQYTVIHAGFAITMLDEASALQTLKLFDEIGLLEEELGVPDDIAIVDRSTVGAVDTTGVASLETARLEREPLETAGEASR